MMNMWNNIIGNLFLFTYDLFHAGGTNVSC